MLLRNPFFVAVTCAFGVAAQATGLHVAVLDFDTGEILPCRIHLKDAAGKAVRPQGLPFWYDHFVCAGIAELDLIPGTYSYEIDRGPEFLLATGTWTVSDSGTQTLTNRLRRLVNLSKEGWWSGELHVHRQPADIELLPVWLASGMVDAIGIAHNHMQRAGVLANEAWGRPRDKQRLL
jgi:hypothetical protein